ncbi:hypothetical protein GCM10008932_24080 [Alkalibacterium iburiense]|uniref:Mannosyl-glycoprotein endo-beta-N-acetylglucosaminidase n=1 Tax=Alkalibacterium iburiense TaxID=290589 RepID=A0ABP3HJT8_9LACT
MDKETKQLTNPFEKELFNALPETIRPKGVKIGINTILEWKPIEAVSHAIYKSSTPLADRKKGYKINPLANTEAKIQSLALMGSNSETYSAVGGSETMDIYAFDYWQYVESLVFWDGLVPTPDVIDAGHRNGVPVFGTLFFNWSTAEKDQDNVRYFLQKDKAGKYPVAHKLIKIAEFYGFDGYFINQESAMPADEGYGEEFRQFLLYLKRQAKEANYPIHISWYDSMDNDGSRFHHDAVNASNDLYVKPSKNQINPTDEFFMNFNWNPAKVESTVQHMKNIERSPYDAYAGWELQAGGYYNTNQKKHALFGGDGQTKLSLGLFIPDSVMGIAEDGEDFHVEADKFWTGFGGNPATEADEYEWSGMSRFVVDNTPILTPHFHTSFNTGHGKAWFVDGKKMTNNSWNSRGIQEVLPTWRWWIDNKEATVKGRYDFDEAFNGGTSLAFEGSFDTNGQSDVMLYSTGFEVEKETKLKVTFKDNQAVIVEIGLSTDSTYSEDSFKYYALEHSDDWRKQVLALRDLEGQTIYAIKLGLRSDQTVSDYKLNLGELTFYSDDSAVAAPVESEIVSSLLFNAQEAEAIINVKPVKGAKHYEVYQANGSNWAFLNASSSSIIYLSQISRSKEATGTKQELKVLAVGENGVRSEPFITSFDWGMETTDTTLPKEESRNIMTEAIVTSYIDPASTENPKNILTGTINNNSDKWYSSNRTENVDVQFNHPRQVVRWVVEHAGAGGEAADDGSMNTKDFNLEYKDLETAEWKIAVKRHNVNEHITDVILDEPITAQEWRLNILTADNGSPWGGIRIYNWKMYESINSESENLPMTTAKTSYIKENDYSVALSNGIEGSKVYLYSDKEAENQLAEGLVNSHGQVVFHQVTLEKESGLVYYHSQQAGLDFSHILAIPYQKSARSLENVTLENSASVLVNQAQPLDLSEHYLRLNYSDESHETVRLDNILVVVETLDNKQQGKQRLSVSYAGVESELPLVVDHQPIDFETKEIAYLELVQKPRTTYLKGESLNLSEGVVTIHYADGTDYDVSLTDSQFFSMSSFNKNQIGVQTLTVTHRHHEFTFDVVVKEETVNFQRLDQLIGKVNAFKHQDKYKELSEKEKEKIDDFLQLAKEKRTEEDITQAEVDQIVAAYSN